MTHYDHRKIEKKWQEFWKKNKTFKAKNFSKKPKYYALDMFPYPSGAGLHVGHPLGYTATDIICRKNGNKGLKCCIRWVGMRSGCLRKITRLRPAFIPRIPRRKILTIFDVRFKVWGFLMIGHGKLIRRIRNIIDGASGFFYNCTKKAWRTKKKWQ